MLLVKDKQGGIMRKFSKLYLGFLYRNIFLLVSNKRLFKIKANHIHSGISNYCVINVMDGRSLLLGRHSSIGDFTKICVDDQDKDTFSKLEIGNYTYIGDHNNIRASGGDIIIGNYCLISQQITMVASNHAIKRDMLIFDQPWDAEKTGITIEDDVWIGANAVILPGVVLRKGCVVAAGAVVTKDVPEYAVVTGVPAQVIKYRS